MQLIYHAGALTNNYQSSRISSCVLWFDLACISVDKRKNGTKRAGVMMIVAIDALYNLPIRGWESAAAVSITLMLKCAAFSVKSKREGRFRRGEVLAQSLG
jgi:hypothetical protein